MGDSKQFRILIRVIPWADHGFTYEVCQRHVAIVIAEFGMVGVEVACTPGSRDGADKAMEDEGELTKGDAIKYRV